MRRRRRRSPAYRIYFGTNAGNYAFVTNAGLVLTQTVVLPHSGRWFFAATAVDANGLESDFSNEVQWEAKPVPPVVQGEPWFRLWPELWHSTNQVDWVELQGRGHVDRGHERDGVFHDARIADRTRATSERAMSASRTGNYE